MTATDGALEAALRDLGPHLDAGATAEGRAATVAAVLDRLGEGGTAAPAPSGARWRPSRRVLAAAAALLVAVAVVAASPARDAVAGWLGLGAVEIRTVPVTPPDPGPAPTLPPGPVDRAALQRALPFPLRLPPAPLAGEPVAAAVDPVVDDLVEIRYEAFTLVEVASQPGAPPSITKSVGPGTEITPVEVAGRPGLWLTGDPHEVAHVRPDGTPVVDSVRRAGDVLVWEDGGVTYRIEGAASLDGALGLAAALR